MSRVKIVKEAGAKPTDFENTVAKVRRSILTRSENRRGRGRVAGYIGGNPTRALLYAKMGLTRKRAQKKARARGGTQKTRTGWADLNVATRASRVERARVGFRASRCGRSTPKGISFLGPKECLCTGRRRRCVFMTTIEDKNRRRHRFVSIRRRGF